MSSPASRAEEMKEEEDKDVTVRIPGWLVRSLTNPKQVRNVILIPVASIVMAAFLTKNLHSWILYPLYRLIMTTVGTIVGVGLGLGLAAHVYETLESLQLRHGLDRDGRIADSMTRLSPTGSSSRSLQRSITPSGSITGAGLNFSSPAMMMKRPAQHQYWGDDSKSVYAELMATAGYEVVANDGAMLLRAQIVKHTSEFFQPNYPFTNSLDTGRYQNDDPLQYKAVNIMLDQWPTLPSSVSIEIGRFIEHLMRDYVASWYSLVDAGCNYEDEREKRNLFEEADASTESQESKDDDPIVSTRKMITSTSRHRPLPLMNTMYVSISLVLGNLAQRVEGVNILSLALLKWVKILSQTLRVYRQMRRSAWAKLHPEEAAKVRSSMNASAATARKSSRGIAGAGASAADHRQEDGKEDDENPMTRAFEPLHHVSEMAVTKEFLLRNKLHRAVTFGMDVPALLFADANGKECGGPYETRSPDDILEERLFAMLGECELDYNRVIGHRLARALLPRSEFSSPIIRSLITELLGGCVLTPVMSCFCPEYMNDWILQACAATEAEEKEGGAAREEGSAVDGSSFSKQSPEELPAANVDMPPLTDEEQDELGTEMGVEIGLSESLRRTGTEEEAELMERGDILSELPEEPGYAERSHSNVRLRDGTSPGKSSIGIEMSMSATDLSVTSSEPEYEEDVDDEHVHHVEGMDTSETRLCQSDADMQTFISDEGDEEEVAGEDEELKEPPTGDFVLPLLTMSLIDLQRFMDFDECREAKAQGESVEVTWDDPSCQESVSQLVLIIEAALLHGRRKKRLRGAGSEGSVAVDLDDSNHNVVGDDGEGLGLSVAYSRYQPSSLSQLLMDMTSDIDGFEERMKNEEEAAANDPRPSESSVYRQSTVLKPTAKELSALRTLIASWLHNGSAHRFVKVLMNSPNSALIPFFQPHSFLRTDDNAEGFVRQLKLLEGVDLVVDTMNILSKQTMDVNQDGCVFAPDPTLQRGNGNAKGELGSSLSAEHATLSNKDRNAFNASLPSGNFTDLSSTRRNPIPMPPAQGTPRYLDFRRNSNFAFSLRAERDRRLKSWVTSSGPDIPGKGTPIISRSKGMSEGSVAMHRELHQLSRVFYAGTCQLSIRNGTRRSNANWEAVGDSGESLHTASAAGAPIPLSLLTVEMASSKRRIEVPDEDSSFLLRAQPRPINAIGLHRDPRNHDQSYKAFAATYEEPALLLNSKKYTGGRYVKRCILRYYPNDRTASIALADDHRELDNRVNRSAPPETIRVGQSATPTLTSEFLRERHLCQKWIPKGAAPRSGSILASSVMEASDFTAAPRNGRAVDFVYRTSLFERPFVELNGKKFQIHDAAQIKAHKADASSLEFSDASLSVALLHVGRDWACMDERSMGEDDGKDVQDDGDVRRLAVRRGNLEVADDGAPVVFVKYTKKIGDKTVDEIKAHRTSFVRAALLVQSARTEAQSLCLTRCVLAGSARSATRQLTETLLMPTIKLLEFASSPEREKQSILLRDLKLGINHIDRDQLRRNALLFPRDPTTLRSLTAVVEGATSVKEPSSMPGIGSSMVMYKIRCTAVVELSGLEAEEDLASFATADMSVAKLFREEWIIYRQFKDFSVFHKHLKSQVAQAEQSASAGARLVGAATAAFSVTGVATGQKRRKALIPSLGQANKAAALGVTKKAIQKRCAILDAYLKYLLSEHHLLNRASELLLFLGAAYPLPPEVRTEASEPYSNVNDIFGRVAMTRIVYLPPATPTRNSFQKQSSGRLERDDRRGSSTSAREDSLTHNASSASISKDVTGSLRPRASTETSIDETEEPALSKSIRVKEMEMIPSVKAKIDEVPLAQVRNGIFELIRYQFDFDNASFFRNRMFAALKTMSFAVTSAGEFRKMLYETHVKYVNAKEISDWIKFTTDMLWPGGMFFEASKPLTEEEQKELKEKAKEALPGALPEQIKSVLGQEIAQGGLDILHEMLNNRVVVKSLSYMLFDLLWLEVFPELQDILTGGEALYSE